MILILKLILTPMLLASATLAARRWGPMVAGWIVGLPLTSAPVSVFLAVEQGREFAAMAAQGSMLSLMGVMAFCLAYAFAAKKASWTTCLLAALAALFSVMAILGGLSIPTFEAAVVTTVSIWVARRAMGKAKAGVSGLAAPPWDLPLRMIVATTIVLTITSISTLLGPKMSGMLAGIPVFICVMSVFSHRLYGADSMHVFLEGVVDSSYGFVAFFLTVELMIGSFNLPLVYITACLATAATNFAAIRLSSTAK